MKKGSVIKNFKKSWIYIKKCKFNLIAYAIVSLIEGVIGAALPLISAKIILNITAGNMDELIYSALSVFLINIVLFIMIFIKGHLFERIHQKTLVQLQNAVARETLKLEISEIDNESTGYFIERLNGDTSAISAVFLEYANWVSFVLSNIGVLFAVFVLNRPLFFFSLISGIVIFLINRISLNKQFTIEKNLRVIWETKTGLTGELIRGIKDIKVLNAERNILSKTSKKIEDSSKEEIKILNIRKFFELLENNVNNLSDLLFIIFGIYLFKNNMLSIAVFVIIYNYQGRVKGLLLGVVKLLEYNNKFIIASDRVFEVIGNDKFKKEKFGNVHRDKIEGNIKFENVSFGYDENKLILDNLNFEIKPNEVVAFVGKSGAGKTTIFNLITKLYEKNSGNIYLDDVEIDDLDKESLRNNMSIITQSSYIFNFTLKENLLLAKPDATMKEIKEACKAACIDDFIESLPDKYETLVGENGVILSGGQKQRIAIARALLMKTEIILLDEATSALDNETQSEIQKAIQNLKGEYTILIVAHRLSTVIDSNKIFVIDDGNIIDSGTHEELLKTCDFYKSLYNKDIKAPTE